MYCTYVHTHVWPHVHAYYLLHVLLPRTSTTYMYMYSQSVSFSITLLMYILTLTQKFTNPQIYPDVLISDQKMDVDLDFDPNTHAPAFCKLVECVLEVLVLNLCS